MARAARQEPYPYILEGDIGLDKKFQTIFYIKLKNGHDANLTSQRYSGTVFNLNDSNKPIGYDVDKSDVADREEFAHIVKKVENFDFGEEYYADHTVIADKIKKVKDEDGNTYRFISLTDEKTMLMDIAKLLPSIQLKEVLDAASDISKLEEGIKK